MKSLRRDILTQPEGLSGCALPGTRTLMRPLGATLASIPPSPAFSHSSAIFLLNSCRPTGWCLNHRQAQHFSSEPGRKRPGQLLAIQPETLFGWPTLWHYFFSTVTPFFFFLLPFLFSLAGKDQLKSWTWLFWAALLEYFHDKLSVSLLWFRFIQYFTKKGLKF